MFLSASAPFTHDRQWCHHHHAKHRRAEEKEKKERAKKSGKWKYKGNHLIRDLLSKTISQIAIFFPILKIATHHRSPIAEWRKKRDFDLLLFSFEHHFQLITRGNFLSLSLPSLKKARLYKYFSTPHHVCKNYSISFGRADLLIALIRLEAIWVWGQT